MKVYPINIYSANNTNHMNSIKIIERPLEVNSYDILNIRNKNLYSDAVMFEGVSAKGLVRQRGMYHHISALPATGSFCGQFLDVETNKFIEFLARAKQTHWIVNPLNELTEDMCPYNPIGRFSKNKYLVNMNVLASADYGDLLKKNELSHYNSGKVFDLEMLKTQKDPLFKKAYFRFMKLDASSSLKKEYDYFCQKNNDIWLDVYAVYNVVANKYGQSWYQWDKNLVEAPDKVDEKNSLDKLVFNALKKIGAGLSYKSYVNQKDLYKFEQFLFDKQFRQTIKILEDNNLKIMTDFPIGVCSDGVDTWANKEIFFLDKETLRPTVVTGCPSKRDGKPFTQVWGHAQLDLSKAGAWNYLENSLKQMLELSDVRLDHFAAYANRTKIPTKHIDENGRVLLGNDIFKESPAGMGVGFFDETWIEDVATLENPNKKNENIFDMFIRLAKEFNKDSRDAYMIESLGKLTETKAYQEGFEEKYGDLFTHQRMVFPKNLEDLNVINELDTSSRDFVVLTSNHDKPAMRETIRLLLDKEKNIGGKFTEFCKKDLQLKSSEILDLDFVLNKLMHWFYTRFEKHHIHTTLIDALGLEGRFNFPGTTNSSEDKYLMKQTLDGLIWLWTQVMPRGFLDKVDKNGNHSGYKDRAEKFIDLQASLNLNA